MDCSGKRSGYTLVELIVALGIFVILGLISTKVYQSAITDSRQLQLTTTRDQIVLWLRQNASDARNLKNSLKQPENIDFYNCVCGKGAGCTSSKTYDFVLYDMQDNPITPLPLYFNTSGIPCDKNSKNCLIEVKTSFIAQCMPPLPAPDPSPPWQCANPVEFFGIFFTVQQNPLTTDQGSLFRSVSGSAFTQVANLGAGICP